MEGKKFGVVLRICLAAFVMVVLISASGCKQQQQMQQQIEAVDGKMSDAQKRITYLDNELKKTNFEITQLKALITKLGNVVVDLQKMEEEKAKAAEAAKAANAAHHGAAKKKAPPAKKRH